MLGDDYVTDYIVSVTTETYDKVGNSHLHAHYDRRFDWYGSATAFHVFLFMITKVTSKTLL